MRYMLSFLFTFFCSAVYAQNDTGFYAKPYKTRNAGSFSRSHTLLSFAYGLPNQLAVENKSGVYQNRSWFGPVIARLEFPISTEIGIAPQASFYSVKFTDFIGGVDKASVFNVGVLGMYHFNKLIPVPKLDLYTGVGLNLAIASSQWNVGRIRANNLVSSGTSLDPGFLAVIGSRYYLSSQFAVFAEGGFPGGSYFDAGITFKLK